MYTAPMLLSATRQQLHPTEHRLNTSVVVKLGERGRKCKKVSTIVKDVTIFTHDYVIRLTHRPRPPFVAVINVITEPSPSITLILMQLQRTQHEQRG